MIMIKPTREEKLINANRMRVDAEGLINLTVYLISLNFIKSIYFYLKNK